MTSPHHSLMAVGVAVGVANNKPEAARNPVVEVVCKPAAEVLNKSLLMLPVGP
ncbi:hypothetical protein [Escherichia coli]|uniref:hypothetical protein n=1 Tax=Escherichia coli TaxID=562 RepID=UPI003F7F9DCE